MLAYRANRDLIRRGALPTWLDSHQSLGAASWSYWSQPVRKRVQALRTLRDLRWHGENKAVATQSHDPQVSACPICHRFWSQAHVLCECPSTTAARTEGSMDLNFAVSRLPAAPCWIWVGSSKRSSPPIINPLLLRAAGRANGTKMLFEHSSRISLVATASKSRRFWDILDELPVPLPQLAGGFSLPW